MTTVDRKPHRSPRLGKLVGIAILPLFTAPSGAQCQLHYLPGQAYASLSGSPKASVRWDPDGSGPSGPVLVVAGSFAVAGNVVVNHIAIFDEAAGTWSPLGSGMSTTVSALAVLATGELVAGGAFGTAGGTPANRVAKWNGTTWSALGSGLNSAVNALVTLPNGDLIAGGAFTTAGGVPANRVARWDGTAWSALGAGVGGTVNALSTAANGDLVVAGSFTTAGGSPAANIARWNGAIWSPFGSGTNTVILTCSKASNGDLLLGGSFTAANGLATPRVARLDTNTGAWTTYGTGLSSGSVQSLLEQPNGDLWVGGLSMVNGTAVPGLAVWNGTTWTAPSGITYAGGTMLTPTTGGRTLVGGSMATTASPAGGHLHTWDGANWSLVGNGMVQTGVFLTSAEMPNGDIVVGGSFTGVGTLVTNNVARWDGSNWHALGGGINGSVASLLVLPNGDLIAGGSFTQAGGTNLARWDGTNWSSVGAGVGVVGGGDSVASIVRLPNGDLAVGGMFGVAGGQGASHVAIWNGTTWSSLAGGVTGLGGNVGVRDLAVMPNGDLVATGVFTSAGGAPASYIARWNGTTWSTLGSGLNFAANALAVLPNGDLVAGGNFTAAGGSAANKLARWDGTAWHAMGSGTNSPPVDLLALANGDLIVIGAFSSSGGIASRGLARWRGTVSAPIGTGLNDSAYGLSTTGNGDILVVGVFSAADDRVAAKMVRLASTCPATVTAMGTSCVGSAGSMVLSTTTLPWIGTTFTSTCSGFTASALGFAAIGFTSPGVPLASLHPAGLLGCDLLASPDTTFLLLPVAGIATASFALPTSSVFAGVPLRQQVLQLELGPGPSLIQLLGSNALALVLGAY